MKKIIAAFLLSTAPAMAQGLPSLREQTEQMRQQSNYNNQQMLNRSQEATEFYMSRMPPAPAPQTYYAPPVYNGPTVLGRSSLGGERRGVIGLFDAMAHGQCWQSPQDGRTYCDH